MIIESYRDALSVLAQGKTIITSGGYEWTASHSGNFIKKAKYGNEVFAKASPLTELHLPAKTAG